MVDTDASGGRDGGQEDKHEDSKKNYKQIKRDIKSVHKDIEDLDTEKARILAFKEKTTTSCISVLIESFRATDKLYYLKTNIFTINGIALYVNHVKDHYKNKIPFHSHATDKDEYSMILSDLQIFR